MSTQAEVLESLRLELQRGCLTFAALAELRDEATGYTLRKALAERGLQLEAGTVCPLLRRLESQGLLIGEWRAHNKRFYRLSPAGRLALNTLAVDWYNLTASVDAIL